MQDGVQLVRHDPQVRTVILKSSSPGIFCAGADLKERKEMTDREVMITCSCMGLSMSYYDVRHNILSFI